MIKGHGPEQDEIDAKYGVLNKKVALGVNILTTRERGTKWFRTFFIDFC
jgi:hypothetical protein